jgi:hypothetical protein
MDSVDYTLFERFVALTDNIWWFAEHHPYLGATVTALSALANWWIFRYHLAAMDEPGFLINNIDVAGRFSRPTYDMWMAVALVGAPIGLTVVAFSMATQMRTIPFLACFGIRGNGVVKADLMARSLREYTVFKYFMPKMLSKTPTEP